VILDKSQWTEKYSGATYLANHKIPVLIDDKHAIAHNKVMIIDDNTVITGSFNFTDEESRIMPVLGGGFE
jgi:phosphatidylserine/phosphatidylglycerophosphate/cardiolipin synthase-like enzyme